ncbi:hypothetical protein BCV69DRAFT_285213 [Microstroma glucosiphilum]|uniref:GDP/GTP exchange factor Sec2 N-terminal domain-containing protein n=1 Tax=Pseudomicrostroma glucosiphilum TaxID=1684307 RepID=A0A316TYU4_9BASI|nr:hypothetical protein BCV69DRAFT_285213 [Pseudomicrostroma glucosiphilum]PWN18230.1 hypothetical protein BCV69DRAFT_285213 [Pseudomicrostroma glucosiphilum]
MALDDGRANGSSGEASGAEVQVDTSQQPTDATGPATPAPPLPDKLDDFSDAQEKMNDLSIETAGSSAAVTSDRAAPSNLASAIAPITDTTDDDVETLKAKLAELSNQVSDLNSKLVTSFNRVSDLEDDLSEAKEKAMTGTTRVAELEKERQEHLAALNTGLLVEKAHVSSEMQRMMDRVIEETKQRGQAESDKAKIESELDELSASLFGEANRMVAVERLARARADEKSKQMEDRLQDTEGIMLEQQKVLGDLQSQLDAYKAAEEHSRVEDDEEGGEMPTVGKSTTAVSMKRQQTSADTSPYQDRRLLMLDIVPYQELRSFLDHLRKLRKSLAPFYNYPYDPRKTSMNRQHSLDMTTPNRASSPAMGSTLSAVASLTSQGLYSDYHQSTASSVTPSSPFAAAGVSRHKDYPTLPSNCEQLVHIPSQLSLPFIKRSQEEDSDPCLRIDFAPGLNWLTRRTANTSVLEGNLLIEPLFPGGTIEDAQAVRDQYSSSPPAACAMCGMLLVNVPLPGGEDGKSTTGTPDLRTVSGWASSVAAATNSAALSLREAAGSSQKAEVGEKPSLKSSRSGLFGSLNALRSKTGSPKPTQQSQPSIGEVEQEATVQATATPAAAPGPIPAVDFGSLPIPTHIFRISESSNARYLLCPHHCLVRLRAACAFWGYIRHIERAVVLEGKLAWDNEQAAPPAGGVVKPQARRASVAPATTTEISATDSEMTKVDSQISYGTEVAPAVPLSDELPSSSLEVPRGSGSIHSNDAAGQSDDGFHDADAGTAPPSPEETFGDAAPALPTKATATDDTAQEGAVAEPSTETPSAAEAGTSETPEAPIVSAADGASAAPSPAPAVPPRRLRPVPSPAPTASATEGGGTPTLPPLPRRPTNPPAGHAPGAAAASAATALPALAPLGIPPRKTLRVDGVLTGEEKPLIWDEKVYLEVLRLKRVMWEARIGVKEE